MYRPTASDDGSLITHPSLGKVAVAAALVQAGQKALSQARSHWRDHLAYTLTITDRDPLYDDTHLWLTGLLPNERQRSLLVTSRSVGDETVSFDDDGREDAGPLRLMYNDERTRRVVIDGHRVVVNLRRPDVGVEDRRRAVDKIEFTCATRAAQDAVIMHLRRLHEGRTQRKRPPVLRMVGNWGDWQKRSDIPPRTLDSVILPQGQLQRIVADLSTFLGAEDQYNRLAIPWHRGYMFHGPPGTGKTSLVKALATHFGLDLWYVPLSDLKTENSLMALLSNVSPRSMLLLEDIDTVKITHERDVDQGGISMSSLLNALDGVATPHGLIAVMTTNHFDTLDDALVRSGRMDCVEEIEAPTWSEVEALGRHFYGAAWPRGIRKDWSGPLGLSMADVAEIFKRHLDDPKAAAAAVTTIQEDPWATPRT